MEKGFNDDELAQIMDEIESLEKEFSEESEIGPAVTPQVECHDVPENDNGEQRQEHSDGEHEIDEQNVMEGLANMPIEESTASAESWQSSAQEVNSEDLGQDQDKDEEHQLKVVSSQSHQSKEYESSAEDSTQSLNQSTNRTAMSFHVEGDMSFELTFHIAGKFVGLTVTDEGLEIGLDGGVKFSVPIEEGAKQKKVA